MNIQEKLSRLLELANKAAVARKVGLSAGTLSGYLNGRRSPNLRNTYKLAGAMGVDFAWLADDRFGWPPVRVETSELKSATAA